MKLEICKRLYIKAKIFVCYLVITKDFIDFGFINNKSEFDKKDVEILAHKIQTFRNSDQCNIEEIEKQYYDLSQEYFAPLLGYSKSYKKVYINHDLSLPFISSNLIRQHDKWLLEDVDFIVNVLNKNYFVEKDIGNSFQFGIATLGKKSDTEIIKANAWCNNQQCQNDLIKDFEESLFNIKNILKEKNKNSLLIISHGIQNNSNNNLTGALSIEGNFKTYTIDDFDFINDLGCIALLTCSGGSLSIGEHETSNSIVSKVLSKNIHSALLCRWDVFLEPSLKIFEDILASNDMSIENALNKSIREFLKLEKWQHPVYWAGIEIWKN